MKKLGRYLTAMVTPFTDGGEVDYEQAKKLALALLDSGSDGVVVAATTGEAPTLSWEEELQLFKEIKSAVGDNGTIVAYTGSNSTTEAVEATRGAEKIGVDACRWSRIITGRRRRVFTSISRLLLPVPVCPLLCITSPRAWW